MSKGTLQEQRVLCKECWAGGQTSKVYPRFIQTEDPMGGALYYDEEGRYHVHDAGEKKTEYRCSKGHVWEGTQMTGCWCGWKADQEPPKPPASSPSPQ